MKLILFLLLLTGCSPQYVAELRARDKAEQQEKMAQLERGKKSYCSDMGAPEGSPNYYTCRKDLEERLDLLRVMDQQGPSYPTTIGTIIPSRPIGPALQCRSYPVGNQVMTDCN